MYLTSNKSLLMQDSIILICGAEVQIRNNKRVPATADEINVEGSKVFAMEKISFMVAIFILLKLSKVMACSERVSGIGSLPELFHKELKCVSLGTIASCCRKNNSGKR